MPPRYLSRRLFADIAQIQPKRPYLLLACGLDDYLVAKSPEDFEDLPCHALDSDYIESWRGAVDAGLPEIDLSRMPAEWLSKRPAPIQYLVNLLIPRAVAAVLNGPGGVGKSYLLLWLSMAVACGSRFLGLGTQKGRVIYVGMEDTADVLRERVFWLHKHYGSDNAQALQENLTTVSLVGQQLHMGETRGGAAVQTRALAQRAAPCNHQRGAIQAHS